MLASVRSARLNELLVLQGELRRDNVCTCGVADEVGESIGALIAKVRAVLR